MSPRLSTQSAISYTNCTTCLFCVKSAQDTPLEPHGRHPSDLATFRVQNWEGGGGQNRSFLCEGTRVGKENEARFAPGLQPWYQPLKELGGLPHQFKGSHLASPPGEKASRACRRYLQFLKEETFSQAGFKKAAELGTELLRLANGWEEACRVLRRTWIEDQGRGSTRTPPTKEVRGSGVPLTPA